MKETDKLEIGDLVFAFRYQGEVNSATVGIVLKLCRRANPRTAWTEVTIFTANGYEKVHKRSCKLISKRR
tara:strand:+ start:78 stop:287 length:210 start_codon:yes stop_codon:yes gene_type:complete